ncbi:MAG: DNA helicase RecQ [Oscillospiraceae bacterium]|nr:DNA helicase RecQ [Oscillospiraceae bacterium]
MGQTETSAALLKQYFGYTAFRAGQAESIEEMLSGRDVLCVMPTGAGKSICYQVPALALPGVTLVISPLISLMKDQVSALLQLGVRAAYLNSSLSAGQYKTAMARAAQSQYKIIYVAPERLLTESFQAVVRQIDVSMVAVDEAHCISQWGQDFRPSYLQIADFIRTLPRRPVVGAFTATATEKVREDIRALLELNEPYCLTTGFDRPNLSYEVRAPRDKTGELLAILRGREEQSGIVYCATRKNVELVAGQLRKAGYSAGAYHAGMADAERARSQEDFQYDRIRIMVATNAFGMGIDKANVSFVVHYNMPKNMESYYQEAGRAGRDGSPAACILLYSGQDVQMNKFLIEKSTELCEDMTPEEREQRLEKEHALLKHMTWYATTTDCLRGYILRYFGEEAHGYCGSCGNCLQEFETVDATAAAYRILTCVTVLRDRGRSFGKRSIAEYLHGRESASAEKIRAVTAEDCGSLSVMPVQRICDVADRLIEAGVLAVSKGDYPVLECTGQTEPFLRLGETFTIKVPKRSQAEAPRRRGDVRGAGDAALHPVDETLLAALRDLRTALAKQANLPAYVIFTDAALRDMCARRPRTEQEFLQVSGVGEHKMKKYGAQFLSVIAAYVA